jgi:metal-responsive CopG/Arc/MetJ family transcriptional regulator
MIISIWIKKKSLDKIDALAKKKDVSRSAAISWVINEYIKDSIDSP